MLAGKLRSPSTTTAVLVLISLESSACVGGLPTPAVCEAAAVGVLELVAPKGLPRFASGSFDMIFFVVVVIVAKDETHG